MSLSPLLLDIRQRYKKGSEYFIQWLADTARSTGTVNEIFSTKRPKGKKSRKAAKEQPQTYEISVKSLQVLADTVAKSDTIQVPKDMIIVLADVIRGRKECAAWYKSLPAKLRPESQSAEDDGHEHFIDILKGIYEMLKLKCPELALSSSLHSEDDQDRQVANIFQHLTLEEPTEETHATTAKAVPVPAQKKARDTYKLETTAEDITFAIFSFLKTMNNVRLFIRRIWSDYKAKKVLLQTASESTNAAVHTLRRLNEQFLEEYPQFEDHSSMLNHLSGRSGIPDDQHMLEDPTSTEFFCDRVTKILEHVFKDLTVLRRRTRSEYSPFDYITNSRHTSNLRLSEKEKDWFYCLVCYWLQATNYDHSSVIPHDQIAYAFVHLRKSITVPTWVAFVAQSLADTQEILSAGDREGTLREYHAAATWITNDLFYVFRFGTDFLQWKSRQGKAIQELEKTVGTELSKDDIEIMMHDTFGDVEWREKWFFLRHVPASGGCQLSQWLTAYHNFSVSHCSESNAILDVAHLYNAAQQSNLLPEDLQWQDLQYVIEQQGDSYFYIGARPTEPPKFYQHHCMARGVKAVNLAKPQEGRPAAQTGGHKAKKNFRPLQRMALCAELAGEWKRREFVEARAHGDMGAFLEQLVRAHLAQEDKNAAIKQLPSGSKASARTFAPVESLELFMKALQKDEFALAFNLNRLNERCLGLLRDIRDMCTQEEPVIYPKDDFKTDEKLGNFVSFFFWVHASGSPQDKFSEACKMMAELVEKKGGREYKAALERTTPA